MRIGLATYVICFCIRNTSRTVCLLTPVNDTAHHVPNNYNLHLILGVPYLWTLSIFEAILGGYTLHVEMPCSMEIMVGSAAG